MLNITNFHSLAHSLTSVKTQADSSADRETFYLQQIQWLETGVSHFSDAQPVCRAAHALPNGFLATTSDSITPTKA